MSNCSNHLKSAAAQMQNTLLPLTRYLRRTPISRQTRDRFYRVCNKNYDDKVQMEGEQNERGQRK